MLEKIIEKEVVKHQIIIQYKENPNPNPLSEPETNIILWHPPPNSDMELPPDNVIAFMWSGRLGEQFELIISDEKQKNVIHKTKTKKFIYTWKVPNEIRGLIHWKVIGQNKKMKADSYFKIKDSPKWTVKNPQPGSIIESSLGETLQFELSGPNMEKIIELSSGGKPLRFRTSSAQLQVPIHQIFSTISEKISESPLWLRIVPPDVKNEENFEKYWFYLKLKEKLITKVESPEAIMMCQNGKWLCLQPIKVKLTNQIPFSFLEIKWLDYNQNITFSEILKLDSKTFKNNLTLCPPYPLKTWFIALKTPNNMMIKNDEKIGVTSKISHPPTVMKSSLLPMQSSYLVTGTIQNCSNSQLKVEFIDDMGRILSERIFFGNFFIEEVLNNPSFLEITFIDPTNIPLSNKSRIQLIPDPFLTNLIKQPKIYDTNQIKAQQRKVAAHWNLVDLNKLYLTGNDNEPFVNLSWNSKPTFNMYHIQIAEDIQFSKILFEEKLTQHSFRVIIPTSLKTIFWRVRGIEKHTPESETLSEWSTPRKVEIEFIKSKNKPK
ncbi:MAG: hypothetical protein NZ480_03175, partial [Bdellovibrionaceae bacterium]|nr:hypothetical protein [Pseudobdellovibrionaceae bacterium]MDW8189925.1 hypothetical protein [Pseudobdellovibrionaceae bacterium]